MNALASPAYNLDQPWLRQPCDAGRAWSGFLAYRGLPLPRSLRRAVEAAGRPAGDLKTFEKWSASNGWVDRVELYDAYLDRQHVEVIIDVLAEDARAVANRHAGIARDAIECAHSVVRGWLERTRNGETLEGWSPGEVRGMLKDMVTLERLVRGEATERVEHGLADLSQLSVEELEQMRALEAKAGVIE